tara:strand:- start:1184 stop:1297 length:114 start_codon:yes stop_codon:yes gene_type:complete
MSLPVAVFVLMIVHLPDPSNPAAEVLGLHHPAGMKER